MTEEHSKCVQRAFLKQMDGVKELLEKKTKKKRALSFNHLHFKVTKPYLTIL